MCLPGWMWIRKVSRHRQATNIRMISKVVVTTIKFLAFFYSTTIVMSLMYALDAALLRF